MTWTGLPWAAQRSDMVELEAEEGRKGVLGLVGVEKGHRR